MIQEIYVKNFVLMEEVQLSFQDQMSAFTGETGAGKSLLMDAIGILKGDRIKPSLIQQGKEKAIIEGTFHVEDNHPAKQILIDAGYELEENCFIASREFTREGKSITRINQRTVNVSFLRDVLATLVDIHSQQDTQYLLNGKYHIQLLDRFCGNEQLLKEVKEKYHIYHQLQEELSDALQEDYNEEDLEYLTFQLNEIEESNIQENELDHCVEESKRLQAYEKISTHVFNAMSYLFEEGKAKDCLYEGSREIKMINEDPFFMDMGEKLNDLYYQLGEREEEIKDHMEHFEYDEEHYQQLQDRIFLIHKLLRKYGPTVNDIKKHRDSIEQKIDHILHRSDFIAKQETLVNQAKIDYEKEASKLHDLRCEKAIELEKLILVQLHDLKLENAQFHVAIEEREGNSSGMDSVQFLISMNAGESLKPLNTTASGGELSRFMLGLKTVFSALQGIETIIFDEIDTGVSGAVAFQVGRKMQEIAKQLQVFCVTHLPSVTACANQHYIVEKKQGNNTTTTYIRELNEEERIQELAMIANNSNSDSALKAAQELFKHAQQK